MSQIEIEVGGRLYPLTCRDDEEAQLRRAAALLDRRCREASAAMGILSEPKQLLLGALLIADELLDVGASLASPSSPSVPDAISHGRFSALAQRVENLCAILEIRSPSA